MSNQFSIENYNITWEDAIVANGFVSVKFNHVNLINGESLNDYVVFNNTTEIPDSSVIETSITNFMTEYVANRTEDGTINVVIGNNTPGRAN